MRASAAASDESVMRHRNAATPVPTALTSLCRTGRGTCPPQRHQHAHSQPEDTVKFGVMYNTGGYGVVDPDAMLVVARHAEACGFESFYVAEPVALYPGATGGA